jgi:arylformamidase
MRTPARLVDLSHPIESGMETYPGLPSPRIEPYVSHAASRANYLGRAEFTITRVFLVGNTGTYVDSPWHRYRDGRDVADLPLERVAELRGVCVDARFGTDRRAVDVRLPDGDLDGSAVLIRTGWDQRWGHDSYWHPGPYLSQGTVNRLVDTGVALIGVDFWNIDNPATPARPAHTQLLAAGILIVEHLRNLAELPASGFRFSAVPPPVRHAASFPVRAFAAIDQR